jgi:hypothetical protein
VSYPETPVEEEVEQRKLAVEEVVRPTKPIVEELEEPIKLNLVEEEVRILNQPAENFAHPV